MNNLRHNHQPAEHDWYINKPIKTIKISIMKNARKVKAKVMEKS